MRRVSSVIVCLLCGSLFACSPREEEGAVRVDVAEKESPAEHGNLPVEPVDDNRLRTADGDANNWLTYGRTYQEQRHSRCLQLTRKTSIGWRSSGMPI